VSVVEKKKLAANSRKKKEGGLRAGACGKESVDRGEG